MRRVTLLLGMAAIGLLNSHADETMWGEVFYTRYQASKVYYSPTTKAAILRSLGANEKVKADFKDGKWFAVFRPSEEVRSLENVIGYMEECDLFTEPLPPGPVAAGVGVAPPIGFSIEKAVPISRRTGEHPLAVPSDSSVTGFDPAHTPWSADTESHGHVPTHSANTDSAGVNETYEEDSRGSPNGLVASESTMVQENYVPSRRKAKSRIDNVSAWFHKLDDDEMGILILFSAIFIPIIIAYFIIFKPLRQLLLWLRQLLCRHDWLLCECVKCGKIRDKEHDWSASTSYPTEKEDSMDEWERRPGNQWRP